MFTKRHEDWRSRRIRRPGAGAQAVPASVTAIALDGTGVFCLGVNMQPGMTETSLVPALAVQAGMTFEELSRWMMEDSSLDR